MPFTKVLVAALICMVMTGCGGGSGGGESVAAGNANPALASAPGGEPSASIGLWKGTTSDGRQAYGALLSDGSYWFIYTPAGWVSHIAGVVQGAATSMGGTLSSTDGLDFNMEQFRVSAASVSAVYSPPTTWCCRQWVARPTARRSPPTRPASR